MVADYDRQRSNGRSAALQNARARRDRFLIMFIKTGFMLRAASGGVVAAWFGAAARFGATLAVFGAAGFGAPLAESLRRRPLIGESGVRVSGGGGGALLASAIARRQGVVILVALLRSEHFARARVTLYAAARRVRVRLVHCHAA